MIVYKSLQYVIIVTKSFKRRCRGNSVCHTLASCRQRHLRESLQHILLFALAVCYHPAITDRLCVCNGLCSVIGRVQLKVKVAMHSHNALCHQGAASHCFVCHILSTMSPFRHCTTHLDVTHIKRSCSCQGILAQSACHSRFSPYCDRHSACARTPCAHCLLTNRLMKQQLSQGINESSRCTPLDVVVQVQLYSVSRYRPWPPEDRQGFR